jgi:hypothetical protein
MKTGDGARPASAICNSPEAVANGAQDRAAMSVLPKRDDGPSLEQSPDHRTMESPVIVQEEA